MAEPFRTVVVPDEKKKSGERVIKLKLDLEELMEWENLRGKSIFSLVTGNIASFGIGDISTLFYVSLKHFKREAKMDEAFEIIRAMGLNKAAELAIEMVKDAMPLKKDDDEESKDDSDAEGK